MNNVRLAKEEGWRNYLSEMKMGVPQSAIYKKMRQITDKSTKKLHILLDNSSTPHEKIADKHAQSFVHVLFCML